MRIYSKFSKTYGTPLQYSCLENPMDGGAWTYVFSFLAQEDLLEEEMTTHSTILARIIPWTECYSP